MSKNEKKQVKTSSIVGWVVFGLFAAAAIVCLVFTKEITAFFSAPKPDWHPTFQFLFHAVLSLIKTMQIIVAAIALWLLIKLITKISIRSPKGITIAKLLVNFLKWVIALAALFLILSAWGANDVFVLASAGVVTLIIGLGSQALVADILAGIFIVFEGDFQVGDIIIIDGWRGEVQAIGIRTTKLVDAGGNVKIVTNSDIKSIINQTKELSIAKCYVGISYNDRIEKVEAIIADNIEKIKEKIPGIVEGPYYKGVSELADSSVNLLFVAKCKENDIYQVQRDLNREIKILFDDNDIGIPFPQMTLSYEKDNEEAKLSRQEKRDAEKFVSEQKVLSKDVDVKK